MMWVAYSDGCYKGYVAWFLWSIMETHPEDKATIWFKGPMSPATAEAVDLLKTKYEGRFKVVYGFGDGLEGDTRSVRWFAPRSVFESEKYGYFCDVDFVVTMRAPQVLNWNLERMKRMGTPYFNYLRSECPRVVTGIHFVDVPSYYDVMEPILDKFARNPDFAELMDFSKYNDELVLKVLLERGFPGTLSVRQGGLYPGLHLGFYRRGMEIPGGIDPAYKQFVAGLFNSPLGIRLRELTEGRAVHEISRLYRDVME